MTFLVEHNNDLGVKLRCISLKKFCVKENRMFALAVFFDPGLVEDFAVDGVGGFQVAPAGSS